MDPVIHAQMSQLIRDEKELEEEKRELTNEEIPLWEKRVKLAENKGKLELARQAEERLKKLELRLGEIDLELDSIEDKKKKLRYESKRPSGDEVRRSKAMLQSVREGGLIDPDEAELKRKIDALESGEATSSDDVVLDLDED